MLRAMWPSVDNIRRCLALFVFWLYSETMNILTIYPRTANHLPASSGTTTKDFMCFFLFWLISLPAIWFPIHQMFVALCSVFRDYR